MELGQKLKQERLAAGLSQRQLCGDIITRNMLSQIENGSAHPSMDTLRYLAKQLKKPVSFFLDEETVSTNQQRILQARAAELAERLHILEDYEPSDPVFDPEYYYLKALSYLDLAQQALEENRLPLAANYLQEASQAGACTPYYRNSLIMRHVFLSHKVQTQPAEILASQLPDNTQEMLLRAEAALRQEDADRCIALLAAADTQPPRWYFLQAEACLLLKQYARAASYYHKAEEAFPQLVYPRLERCYEALEDYKQAYFYACKQR